MAYDKVVDSAQLDADLKVVADAIRSKGGTTEPLEFPQGIKQAVEAIQSGGGGNVNTNLDALLEDSLIEVHSDVQSVKAYSFREAKSLEYANFPNAKGIGQNAFQSCSNLTEINIPQVTTISANTFSSTGLKRVIFMQTEMTIASNAFSSCSFLRDVYCPWEEGAVANAPWGASKTTIHYNVTYDANGEPII